MFVESNNRREIYTKIFFNNKELLAMGNKSERLVYLISRLFDNPTAVTPHTNIFDMSNENNVNPTTKMVAITPAQEKLLQFISETDPNFLKKAVRRVKDNVLYLSQIELDDNDRTACYLMNLLERFLSKIEHEFKNN